jgi:RHS repeat-associated protein
LTYERETLGRITRTILPAQYGQPGDHRPTLGYTYGVGGSIARLTVDGSDLASEIHHDAGGNLSALTLGPAGAGQTIENYSWDLEHGLLEHQSLTRNGTTLLDLWYDYQRHMPDVVAGKTGQVTVVTNAIAPVTTAEYVYDNLGRVTRVGHGAQGGSFDWSQEYTYDAYGNRLDVTATNSDSAHPVPADGDTGLTADRSTNHVTATGWAYDAAGNLVERPVAWGTLRFGYDAAGRLVTIADGTGNVLQEHLYGACHRRRATYTPSTGTTLLYAWEGDNVIAQYFAEPPTTTGGVAGKDGRPTWFVGAHFLGGRQLVTVGPRYQPTWSTQLHPDRIGTASVTGPQGDPATDATIAWLPYGSQQLQDSAAIPYIGAGFAGYWPQDLELNYAQHRFYDPRAGRFTSPDPLGNQAFDLLNPQTLNPYSYVVNDPVNRTDPLGLMAILGCIQAGDGPMECRWYYDPGPLGTSWSDPEERPGTNGGAGGRGGGVGPSLLMGFHKGPTHIEWRAAPDPEFLVDYAKYAEQMVKTAKPDANHVIKLVQGINSATRAGRAYAEAAWQIAKPALEHAAQQGVNVGEVIFNYAGRIVLAPMAIFAIDPALYERDPANRWVG